MTEPCSLTLKNSWPRRKTRNDNAEWPILCEDAFPPASQSQVSHSCTHSPPSVHSYWSRLLWSPALCAPSEWSHSYPQQRSDFSREFRCIHCKLSIYPDLAIRYPTQTYVSIIEFYIEFFFPPKNELHDLWPFHNEVLPRHIVLQNSNLGLTLASFLCASPKQVIKINISMTLTFVLFSTSDATRASVQTFMIFECYIAVFMSWFYWALISTRFNMPSFLRVISLKWTLDHAPPWTKTICFTLL